MTAAAAAEDNNQPDHDGDEEADHDPGEPVLHGDIAGGDLVIVAACGAAAALVTPLVPVSAGLILPGPPVLRCGVGAVLAHILFTFTLTIIFHSHLFKVQPTVLVSQLSIDTDVIIKAAVLQLRLLLVQVGQLLVALHGPGLCNVTVSHDAGDQGASPAHDPGSHSPQASM